MQSPVLERLVGGAVLLGLLLILALVIGPRDRVRMPDERGSSGPVVYVALQPAEPGIAAAPQEGRPQAGSRDSAQWLPPGSVPHAPQPARAAGRSEGQGTPQSPEAQETPVAAAGLRWAVQLGSFADRGNAVRLSDWCREQGYGVKIVAGAQESSTLFRVRVGPFASRGDARSAMAQLALQGRNSFVTQWDEQAP